MFGWVRHEEVTRLQKTVDKLRVYSDGQDIVIETMRQAREKLIVEMTKAHELNRTLEYQVLQLENDVTKLRGYSDGQDIVIETMRRKRKKKL